MQGEADILLAINDLEKTFYSGLLLPYSWFIFYSNFNISDPTLRNISS